MNGRADSETRITELETQLAAKESTIADLRDLAYNRAPKLAADELQKQKEELKAQLDFASYRIEGLQTITLRDTDEIQKLKAQLAAAEKELDALTFAAHMPPDYPYGLPSWIWLRLYRTYIAQGKNKEHWDALKHALDGRDAAEACANSWATAALKYYPMNGWAFDPTVPEAVIGNIVDYHQQKCDEVKVQLAEAVRLYAETEGENAILRAHAEKAEAARDMMGAACDAASEAIKALEAENAKLRELLRQIQWEGEHYDGESYRAGCVCCGGAMADGHKPGCGLQSALTPEPKSEVENEQLR
jgi:hypothetical protein